MKRRRATEIERLSRLEVVAVARKRKLFIIEPLVGALPLTFGASKREVHQLLGKPGHVRVDR